MNGSSLRLKKRLGLSGSVRDEAERSEADGARYSLPPLPHLNPPRLRIAAGAQRQESPQARLRRGAQTQLAYTRS